MRILVVDDEENIRTLASVVLQGAGYDVDLAVDGVDALGRIAARRPDLVLLDLMMPVLDGWGVLAALRAGAPFPPVLVVSAVAPCAQALQAGASGCLPKPFRIQELLAACARALGASG